MKSPLPLIASLLSLCILVTGCKGPAAKTKMRVDEHTYKDVKMKVTYSEEAPFGQPLKVSVELSNVGSQPVHISQTRSETINLRFDLENSKGDRVKMTELGEKSPFSVTTYREHWHKAVVKLAPGESYRWDADLSVLYPLSPDSYSLKIGAVLNTHQMWRSFAVTAGPLVIRYR